MQRLSTRLHAVCVTSLAFCGLVLVEPASAAAHQGPVPEALGVRLENTTSSTEYIRIADHSTLEPQQFTIECRFTPRGPGAGTTNNTGGAALLNKPREGASGVFIYSWYLGWSPLNQKVIFLLTHTFQSEGRSLSSNATVSIGCLAQVAVTFDGTTIRLYLNGQLDNSVAFGYSGVYYGVEDVLIGTANFASGFTRRFDGEIDDVRLWDHARSAEQIASEMNCEPAGAAPGLLAAWDFNGSSLQDVTGNGHDGVAVGNIGFVPDADADGDGIRDDCDNCPSAANAGQEDADGDGVGDACEGGPQATILGALSRKTCDLAISSFNGAVQTSSEPRQGGITELRIAFDVAPGGPGPTPVSIQHATCSSPTYAPYWGCTTATVSASVNANELVLTFTPGLENARTYKFALGSDVTSIGGQFVEMSGLIGDVNSDGQVNATDRSIVVGAWTGAGFTCATDTNTDGISNATDRSIVVGAWTGSSNCAT